MPDPPPIHWQFEPFEIHSPDGGDTFHVAAVIDGQQQLRAMSRATLIGQIGRAVRALLGGEDQGEIAQMLAMLDRESAARSRRKHM